MIKQNETTKKYYSKLIALGVTGGKTVGGESFSSVSKKTLKIWPNLLAPNSIWGCYLHKNFTDGDVKYNCFLPGLGLLKYNSSFKNEAIDGDIPVLSSGDVTTRSEESPYPAGTDCLGFAQRSASYSGNIYTWYDLVKGYAEKGELSPGSGNRIYPRCIQYNGKLDGADDDAEAGKKGLAYHTYGSDYGFYSFEIARKEMGVKFEDLVRDNNKQLSLLVPGDVFYFYYKKGTGVENHIGIINGIVYDDAGDVSDVRIIESTFITALGALDQYVRNNRSLADLGSYDTKDHYHLVRLEIANK